MPHIAPSPSCHRLTHPMTLHPSNCPLSPFLSQIQLDSNPDEQSDAQVSPASLLLHLPSPCSLMPILCPSSDLFPQAYAVPITLLLPEACAVPTPPSSPRPKLCPPLLALPSLGYLTQEFYLFFLKVFPPLHTHATLFFTCFLSKLYHVDFHKPILRNMISYNH